MTTEAWVPPVPFCGNGHDLSVEGRPRTDDGHRYRCMVCQREAHIRHRGEPGHHPDEMAVDRLVHGDRLEQPRRVDVFHAVTYLERTESLSARQIAERVGVSSRTVVRIRGKLREGVPYGVRVQR